MCESSVGDAGELAWRHALRPAFLDKAARHEPAPCIAQTLRPEAQALR